MELLSPGINRMLGGASVGDSGLCCCGPVQCVTSSVRAQLLPFVLLVLKAFHSQVMCYVI